MIDQKIIEKILSEHSELSRDKILNELELEKQKTGDLIEEETLLRLIGARYGVKSSLKINFDGELSISDLIPGLYNVSIKGRIVAVYPIKNFQGDYPGKLAHLIISDRTALLPVILWNEKTEFIESNKIKPGQILLFSQGYTREDPRGRVELHMGKKSKIKVLHNNPQPKEFPSIQEFSKKIGDITPKLGEVHLVGTVKKVFPVSNFVRSNSSEGSILRFILFDETGELPVVVWNEQAQKLINIIKKNAKLKLVNAKVNLTPSKSLELNVNSYTHIDLFSEKNDG
jgi:ssDNA-binding replication factor A large subunit